MLWHRKFSDEYFKSEGLRTLVDGEAYYCDDIAMNALVSSITHLPPAYVYIPFLAKWRQWNLSKMALNDGEFGWRVWIIDHTQ